MCVLVHVRSKSFHSCNDASAVPLVVISTRPAATRLELPHLEKLQASFTLTLRVARKLPALGGIDRESIEGF